MSKRLYSCNISLPHLGWKDNFIQANAELPLIIADQVGRNPQAVNELVQLAETSSIPVIDSGGMLNFPSTHPPDVTGSDAISRSDVIVLLDVDKLEQTFTISNRYNRQKESRVKPGPKIVNIGLFDQWIKSTTLDFDRVRPVEFTIAADTSLASMANPSMCPARYGRQCIIIYRFWSFSWIMEVTSVKEPTSPGHRSTGRGPQPTST